MGIYVIIPALNEEEAISKVIQDIPKEIVKEVVVVDNGSTDNTAQQAQESGATVLMEKQRGYGFACLKGIHYISTKKHSDSSNIIVFLDGDYSDYPEELRKLIKPILHDEADMVIGTRETENLEKNFCCIPRIAAIGQPNLHQTLVPRRG